MNNDQSQSGNQTSALAKAREIGAQAIDPDAERLRQKLNNEKTETTGTGERPRSAVPERIPGHAATDRVA